MRGNLYKCVFQNGEAIDLQIDFEQCPQGFAWVAWAYTNYRIDEDANYYFTDTKKAPDWWEAFTDYAWDRFVLINTSCFAMLAPTTPIKELDYWHR